MVYKKNEDFSRSQTIVEINKSQKNINFQTFYRDTIIRVVSSIVRPSFSVAHPTVDTIYHLDSTDRDERMLLIMKKLSCRRIHLHARISVKPSDMA